MKYIPYGIAFGVFITAILIAPPHTAQFSFPVPKPALPVMEKKQVIPVEKKQSAPKVSAQPSSPPPTITEAPTPPVQKTVTDIPIDLRSVVVVKCLFKNAAGDQTTTYGSGVMVGAEGYVLTARHVVDIKYTYGITGGKQGLQNYSLDSCRIAVPPDGIKTPTVEDIRRLNSFTPVTEFAYVAHVAFVSPEPTVSGMSDGEYDFADSALMRITSAVSGTMPRSFIASPMKIFELPVTGDEVVSFGFPSGVPSYGNNFYLQGSMGEIKDIVGGDKLFKNQPVGMTAVMEIIGGRSGSPVFWHGYVIGVVSAKEDYSRNSTLSAIFPLARFASEAGIAVLK